MTSSFMNSMIGLRLVMMAGSGSLRSPARYLSSSTSRGLSDFLASIAFSKRVLSTVSGTGPLGSSSKD